MTKLTATFRLHRLAFWMGLPLARELLRLLDLRESHFRGKCVALPECRVQLFFSASAQTCSRKVEPFVRLHEVLTHADAARYMRPNIHCASVSPCSAAFRYHVMAIA